MISSCGLIDTFARRWAGRGLAAGAVMVALAACGTGGTAFEGAVSKRTRTGVSTRAQIRTSGSTPAAPVSPRRPSLTGRLRLARQTVPGGGTVHAELILHSSAHHVRVLDHACPGQFIALVLSGRGGRTSFLWSDQLCRPGVPFSVRPGTTVFQLEARATVGQCIMVGHKPPLNVPQCLPGNRMPALPAGTYEASITARDAALEADLADVGPVRVQVTPRPWKLGR